MIIDEHVKRFWHHWPELRSALEVDLEAGTYGAGTEALTDAVEAIHPDLEWALVDGAAAANGLCLTSGDHRLRHITAAWHEAAPAADSHWEFYPARPPVGVEAFEIDGLDIDSSAGAIVALLDDDSEQFDVTVSHPDFTGLDDANRFQATFRMLDDLLGEDGTEKWIGSVDATHVSLRGAVPLTDFPAMVADLARVATGDRWIVFEDDDPSDPSSLEINLALKRLDHVHLTDYVAAHLRFEDERGAAAPTADDARMLEALEAELLDALGDRGVEFARGLFPGILVLHLYVKPAATPIAEDWARRHHQIVYDIEVDADPGWDEMHDLY